ncbi:MAG TPA: hypothetical protein PK915_11350 [Bacteroidales bacterium]|nr:hypothetical protein [Bacteroidales bacterium]HRW97583.1 hypothetical protein [Bacteroidales bacterium]
MYNKAILKSILLTIVIIAGCKPSVPSKSEIFQDYLIQSHNKIIPENLHYFIVVPGYGCMGCYQAFIPHLTKELHSVSNCVSFIVSNKEYMNDSFFVNYEFLADSNRIIDYLPLDIANLTVILTKDSQIQKVIHLNTTSETTDFINELQVHSPGTDK